jgi:hypothetical protein
MGEAKRRKGRKPENLEYDTIWEAEFWDPGKLAQKVLYALQHEDMLQKMRPIELLAMREFVRVIEDKEEETKLCLTCDYEFRRGERFPEIVVVIPAMSITTEKPDEFLIAPLCRNCTTCAREDAQVRVYEKLKKSVFGNKLKMMQSGNA